MADLLNSAIDSTDQSYLTLRDDPRFQAQRQFLETLWQKYKPYADQNFREEISRQFHPRFWELYLTCTFIEQGHELIRKKGGPDLCIKNGNSYIWIEAIAPSRGGGPDAVPMPQIKANSPPMGFLVPEEKILLRFRSAIEEKYRKYLGYRQNRTIAVTEPFVIAINGAQVPFSSLNDEIPFIVQAVLPFGPASMTIDADTLAIIDAGPAYRPEVVKKSKASVSTCVFLDEQYADISGIFFSNVIFKNFLSALGTDFIYLHNPKATNPLSAGWSKVGTEYWVEDNTLKNKSWNQEA